MYLLNYKWSVVRDSIKGGINSVCLWPFKQIKDQITIGDKLLHSKRPRVTDQRTKESTLVHLPSIHSSNSGTTLRGGDGGGKASR